jgi:hypothetical protein
VGPLAPYPRISGLPFMTVPSRAMSVLAAFTGRREVDPSGRASVSRPGIAMRRPTYL